MKKYCRTILSLMLAVIIGTVLVPIDSIDIFAGNGAYKVYAEEESKTPSGIPIHELEEVIDDMTVDIVGEKVAGMAVAVAKDGKVVFEKGYGYSDIESQSAVDPERTVFELGSTTKTMVWVAAMKLYEDGKLDLNEDIRKYLPKEFVTQMKAKKKITMLNLMNHTAGFDEYLIGLFNNTDNMLDLRESLLEEEAEQYYDPGSVCTYSNYGAGLAGYVVECIAGMDLYEYVRKNIFEPAGMSHTSMHPLLSDNELTLNNRSNAYSYEDKKLDKETHTYVSMYPAGAANGTANDLLRFGMQLSDNDENILFTNRTTREQFFQTTYQSDKAVAGVSHGFFQYEGASQTYWHNGGTTYFHTFLAIVPEQDFVVVVVANTDAGEEIVHQIGWKLVRKPKELMKAQIAAECEVALKKDLPDVDGFTGSYQSARICHSGISKILYAFPSYDFEVKKADEDALYINDKRYRQIEEGVFVNCEDGTHAAFQKMENGEMKFTYIQDYFRVSWEKKLIAYITILVLSVLLLSMPLLVIYSIFYSVMRKIGSKRYLGGASWKKLYGIAYLNIVVIMSFVLNLFICLIEIDFGYYFSQLRYHVYINMGIFLICILLSVLTIKKMLTEQIPNRISKILNIIFSAGCIVFFLIMGILGMYNPLL